MKFAARLLCAAALATATASTSLIHDENYYYWQNGLNQQCLEVRSKRKDDGSPVDVWTCFEDPNNNEQFRYDQPTGHLVDKNSGKCVTARAGCSKSPTTASDICIMACSSKIEASAWDVDNKTSTIRPRSQPSDCLQVDTPAAPLDAAVSVASCASPPTANQIWHRAQKAPPSPAPPSIVHAALNLSATALPFFGIGGLSAGASSRLLADYAPEVRAEIFDVLFKPEAGAAEQILKVEIGGDSQSTDGTEPSHMHTPSDFNCSRGYEWLLINEARQRNPAIRVWGLVWGTPGWVGGNSTSSAALYTAGQYSKYLIKWLECARDYHHQKVDYMGILNEEAQGKTTHLNWLQDFRMALDAAGFTDVLLIPETGVGGISGWGIVDAMASNSKLGKDIFGVGMHYPSGSPSMSRKAPSYPSASQQQAAARLGKALISSEACSCVPSYSTAVAMAAAINRNYINGGITGFVNWALLVSWYDFLDYPNHGLFRATQPWSGNWTVSPNVYAYAHTTQATEAGWYYLKGSQLLHDHASLVAMVADPKTTGTPAFAVVAESFGATADTIVSLHAHGLGQSLTSTGGSVTLHSRLTTTEAWFAQRNDTILPIAQDFQLNFTLPPDSIISFSTRPMGQVTAPPLRPRTPLPFPYRDSFDAPKYAEESTAQLLADQTGTFQIMAAPSKGSKAAVHASDNQAMLQRALQPPVIWHSRLPIAPLSIIGDATLDVSGAATWPRQWANYNASIAVLLPGGAYARNTQPLASGDGLPRHHHRLCIRVSLFSAHTGVPTGYCLVIDWDAQAWSLTATGGDSKTTNTTLLAHGGLPQSEGEGSGASWHSMALWAKDSTISALFDSLPLVTALSAGHSAGPTLGGVAVGTGWHAGYIDDLEIVSLAGQ